MKKKELICSLLTVILSLCCFPINAQIASHSLFIEVGNFTGEDVGEKINVAIKKFGRKQGTIMVVTEGEIRTPIRLGTGQILVFGPGIWKCTASPCIILDNASQVHGAGIYRTNLQLAKTSLGPVIQSKDYRRLSESSEKQSFKSILPLQNDRKGLPGVKYIKISDLTIDGLNSPNPKPQTPNPKPQTPNPKPQTQVNGIELFGFWFWIEDVSIERFTGDGLVTQFIPGAEVDVLGNDAMESYFTRIKLLNNVGNGWTMKGPHDSIAYGVISANNGSFGIDVLQKEGHYSGSGLMLTNTHLYGNGNGMRTEAGANIIATGLESEANFGVGLLLRSNDSVITGTFYANETYGLQIGQGAYYAGANTLTIQAHNNKIAQVNWEKSSGYNNLTGVIYPNDEKQRFFESVPTQHDQVLTTGPYAVQHFSGGVKMDSDRNIYGAILK